MSLSLADIKRAKVASFRDVADALDGMAGANRDMKHGVGSLPIAGDAWKGVSGDAAHHELDGFGKNLDGNAEAQHGAASKIRRAADEFEGVQQLLKKIENDAASGKFTINLETGQVTPPSGKYDKNELDYLTNTLKQIRAAGDTANADLAFAVKTAKELPDPAGAGGALPTTPTSTVKPGSAFGGVQNLATANPDGDPGATKAAAAGADTPANYKEWYPKTAAAGDKLTMDPSKAGSLTGSMIAMEKNRPPDAPYKPAFGERVIKKFGDGFNSRVDGAIEGAKNLVGQGGPGSPGVAESWFKTAKGFTDQVANPLSSLPGDIKDAIHDPAGFAGKKLFDVTSIAAGGPIGGEATAGARGLLDSIAGNEGRALTHTLDDGITAGHPPISADHPTPVSDHHAPTGGDHHSPALIDHGGPNSSDRSGGGDSTPVAGRDYGFAPNDVFKNLSNPDEIARLNQGGVPPHITDGYDHLAGRTADQYQHEFTVPGRDGSPRWDWAGQAPNDGFAGPPTITDRIPQGHLLDRLGSEQGAFMADNGAPLGTRGMPPGVASYYSEYVGTGQPVPPGVPWEVRYGPAKEAFGPGGAPQWVVVDKTTGEQVPVEIVKNSGMIGDRSTR